MSQVYSTKSSNPDGARLVLFGLLAELLTGTLTGTLTGDSSSVALVLSCMSAPVCGLLVCEQ
jgi:hypothetical protein